MVNPIIIKFGGSLLDDKATRTVFLSMLIAEWKIQQDPGWFSKRSKIVLVHGGGKDITRALEVKGILPKFIDGRRFTDQATMSVVEQVLREINLNIVYELNKGGAKAIGLCGKSNGLMSARRLPELGYVGIPTKLNQLILSKILASPNLPVFYSVAQDADETSLNVNADDFAQELAIACHAEHLIFMTDTGGIKNRTGQLMKSMTPRDVEAFIADGTITDGMAVKARACVDALRRGIHQITIAHKVDGLGTVSFPRALGQASFNKMLR